MLFMNRFAKEANFDCAYPKTSLIQQIVLNIVLTVYLNIFINTTTLVYKWYKILNLTLVWIKKVHGKIENNHLWLNPKSALNLNSRRMTKPTIAYWWFNNILLKLSQKGIHKVSIMNMLCFKCTFLYSTSAIPLWITF